MRDLRYMKGTLLMVKHGGLSSDIYKLLQGKEKASFSIADMMKFFPAVNEANLRYHMNAWRKRDAFLSPGRGKYKWNPDYVTVETVRERVAALAPRVVTDGRPFAPGELVMAPVDTKWARILRRHVESVKLRMRNANLSRESGHEFFTEPDFELLDELLRDCTMEVDKLMSSGNGSKAAMNGTA